MIRVWINPLRTDLKLPEKKTAGAAAYDIYMPESGSLMPGQWAMVPLGFAIEVPDNHCTLLLPRSGTGIRDGLRLRNTVGLIDADYRGEMMAAFSFEGSSETVSWNKYDRLFQMMIMPVPETELIVVDELSSTDRGDGGFGSTGVA